MQTRRSGSGRAFSVLPSQRRGNVGHVVGNAVVSPQVFTVIRTHPDQALADELGADPYGMSKYVMAFLKKGPNRDRSPEEGAALQRAHLGGEIAQLALQQHGILHGGVRRQAAGEETAEEGDGGHLPKHGIDKVQINYKVYSPLMPVLDTT